MGSEELSLTWDDHHSTLVGVFEKLLDSSTLVDCTIAAEGQYLKAHKVVLSACSPYFELLFTQENEKNPIVVFKDIRFQELKSMIDFVYRGKVKIPEDRLEDFVAAAECLQIKGIGGSHKESRSKEKQLSPLVHQQSPSVRKGESRVSPVPRKRIRNGGTSSSDKNLSSQSTVIDDKNLSSQSTVIDDKNLSSQCTVIDDKNLSSQSTVIDDKSLSSQSTIINEQSLSSQSTVSNEEINRCASLPRREKLVDISIIPSSELTITRTTAPPSALVQSVSVSVPEDPKSVRHEPSTSYVESVQTSVPLPEREPSFSDCNSVIKTEPEPIAEVFLPESECLVEPKNEVCVEEVSLLDSEDGNENAMAEDVFQQSPQDTSQYSGFPSSRETADMRSSESYLMVQVPGRSSGQELLDSDDYNQDFNHTKLGYIQSTVSVKSPCARMTSEHVPWKGKSATSELELLLKDSESFESNLESCSTDEELEEQTSEIITDRRRLRPETWKRNVKKLHRLRGEGYYDYKNRFVPAKHPCTDPCPCKRKCHEKISPEFRTHLFNQFYEMSSFDAQSSYMYGFIKVCKKARSRVCGDSRRANTMYYFLPMSDGTITNVCKVFFKETFQVSCGRLYRLSKYKMTHQVPPKDRRGKSLLRIKIPTN